MKASNLSRELVISFNTFDSLIIAILALMQLANAAFITFVAPTVDSKMGASWKLVDLHRYVSITLIFFIL